ncbi:MAG: hypothetical protein Kow0029_04400 [Candidatus Rifleibacteriota bacterium]
MKEDIYVNYTLGGKPWQPRFIAGLDQKICTQCSFCLKICPGSVFKRTVKGTIEPRGYKNCIGCGVCEKMCKESAIKCATYQEIKDNGLLPLA